MGSAARRPLGPDALRASELARADGGLENDQASDPGSADSSALHDKSGLARDRAAHYE